MKSRGIRVRTKRLPLTCVGCGTSFLAARSDAQYCNLNCRYRVTYKRAHPIEEVSCLWCGIRFTPGRVDGKMCSHACRMKAWHARAKAKKLCRWCGKPSLPTYVTACAEHVSKVRVNNYRAHLRTRIFREDIGVCVRCGNGPPEIGKRCHECSVQDAARIRKLRAGRTAAYWADVKTRRHLMTVDEVAALWGRHRMVIHTLIDRGSLKVDAHERKLFLLHGDEVYRVWRARIRKFLAFRVYHCVGCGHIWRGLTSNQPPRCPRPYHHLAFRTVREYKGAWNNNLPDWTALRPTDRRGPKPKGQFIVCRTCDKEVWVRPSWAKDSAHRAAQRFCSQACAMDDPGVRAASGNRYSFLQVVHEAAAQEDGGARLMLDIEKAVPAGLSPDVRAEVCQDIAVAILEREFRADEIATHIQRFVKRTYKQFPVNYGPLSLDAQIIGKDGEPFFLRDTISAEVVL